MYSSFLELLFFNLLLVTIKWIQKASEIDEYIYFSSEKVSHFCPRWVLFTKRESSCSCLPRNITTFIQLEERVTNIRRSGMVKAWENIIGMSWQIKQKPQSPYHTSTICLNRHRQAQVWFSRKATNLSISTERNSPILRKVYFTIIWIWNVDYLLNHVQNKMY